jgi:hypothetical protein
MSENNTEIEPDEIADAGNSNHETAVGGRKITRSGDKKSNHKTMLYVMGGGIGLLALFLLIKHKSANANTTATTTGTPTPITGGGLSGVSPGYSGYPVMPTEPTANTPVTPAGNESLWPTGGGAIKAKTG